MNPKIIYLPEWIEKILSGQKTMTIRRTQYPCGIYDVVTETEPEKSVCRIEVVKVEKWDTEKWICAMENDLKYNWSNIVDNAPVMDTGGWDGWGHAPSFEAFPCLALSSGFVSIPDFIQYHRENYSAVKYAHTFQLVKGDNHVS